MSAPRPLRSEIWFLNPDPTEGREQADSRPALVISADAFNQGPADLVVVLPVPPWRKESRFTYPCYHPKAACGMRASSSVKTCGRFPGLASGSAGESPGHRRWQPPKTGCGF